MTLDDADLEITCFETFTTTLHAGNLKKARFTPVRNTEVRHKPTGLWMFLERYTPDKPFSSQGGALPVDARDRRVLEAALDGFLEGLAP